MGPIAARTYPGEAWKPGRNRATFEPDYGRRGKLWVHGAFEPATGQAAMALSSSRDSVSHIQLLEKIFTDRLQRLLRFQRFAEKVFLFA